MVQVGCTNNYGRRCLWKETEESARVDYPGDVGENDSALPSIPIRRVSDRGPVAQLGARFHGMEEVVGTIPTRSTNSLKNLDGASRVTGRVERARPLIASRARSFLRSLSSSDPYAPRPLPALVFPHFRCRSLPAFPRDRHCGHGRCTRPAVPPYPFRGGGLRPHRHGLSTGCSVPPQPE